MIIIVLNKNNKCNDNYTKHLGTNLCIDNPKKFLGDPQVENRWYRL